MWPESYRKWSSVRSNFLWLNSGAHKTVFNTEAAPHFTNVTNPMRTCRMRFLLSWKLSFVHLAFDLKDTGFNVVSLSTDSFRCMFKAIRCSLMFNNEIVFVSEFIHLFVLDVLTIADLYLCYSEALRFICTWICWFVSFLHTFIKGTFTVYWWCFDFGKKPCRVLHIKLRND